MAKRTISRAGGPDILWENESGTCWFEVLDKDWLVEASARLVG